MLEKSKFLLFLVTLSVGLALPNASPALPNVFPRVVPMYYSKADVETVLANPARGQDAIGVSACEVIRSYPDIPARAHSQGLIVVGDMALGHCYPTWNTYNLTVVASLLVQSVQMGVDIISLDESNFTQNPLWVNQLRSNLKAVNPQVQIIITSADANISPLSSFLAAGGQVDAIALEWYKGDAFNNCINLANKYGIRCGYWVDATTTSAISTTFNQAGTVLFWFRTGGYGFWDWSSMKQAIEANIPSPAASPNIGLAFAIIGIGASVGSALGGFAVVMSGQTFSKVFVYGGYYYCKRHRILVWRIGEHLWCPVHQQYLTAQRSLRP